MVDSIHVGVLLKPDKVDLIDELKGGESRSSFCRRIILKWLDEHVGSSEPRQSGDGGE